MSRRRAPTTTSGSAGNAKSPVFTSDEDRERFLDILGEVVDRYGWRCYAYCLMDEPLPPGA